MTPEKITKENQAAAKMVVALLGGPAEAARKLTAKLREADENVKQIRIGSIWSFMHRDKSGIPIKYVLPIELLSGVPREEIRPDIPWR